jgi:primosomal protein N' (replication factor Y)
MVARVTLEIALRREFDYRIPPELESRIEIGTRVQVPFGSRQLLGVVTGLAEMSEHRNLKPIAKIIGAQSLVTPKVLKLARWIADYYCAPVEIALKSVLPEVVRKEQSGWRELLYVRALPFTGELPKLPKRQREVWNIIGNAGNCRFRNCSNSRIPPPRQCASSRTVGSWPLPRKSPNGIPTRANRFCRRNRCR